MALQGGSTLKLKTGPLGQLVADTKAASKRVTADMSATKLERARGREANERFLRWARSSPDPWMRAERLAELRRLGVALKPGELARSQTRVVRAEAKREVDNVRAQLVRDPHSVSKLSLRSLTLVLLDPEFGSFNPEKRSDVLLVQRWLRAHGHAVDETGVLDAGTAAGIQTAMLAAQAHDRKRRTRAIVERYYKDGVLRPGAARPGFPLGVVPRPGELLAILDKGGFTADALQRWLESEKKRKDWLVGDPDYRAWRQTLLHRARVGQFGIFGQSSADGGTRLFPETQLDRLFVAAPELDAVFKARTFPDLQRRLGALERREEKARLDEENRAMAGEPGWFSRMIEHLTFGDDVLASAKSTFLVAGQTIPVPGQAGQEPMEPDWEMVHRFEAAHPWYALGVELALDPTNFIPGKAFTVPIVAGARAGFALERAGIVLTKTGRLGRVPMVLGSPVRGAVDLRNYYEIYLASLRIYVDGARALSGPERTAFQRLTVRAGGFAARATTMRAAVGQAIATRVDELIILNFPRSIKLAGTRSATVSKADPMGFLEARLSADTAAAKEATAEAYARQVHVVWPDVYRELIAMRASIYAGNATAEFSAVGWQVFGWMKQRVRTFTVERIAARHAQTAAAKAGPDAFDEVFVETYQRVIGEYGSHFAGGLDPALAAELQFARRELDEAIRLEWLPAVQRRIVDDQERAGHVLFEAETGLWAGRAGDHQAAMRLLAHASFDTGKVLRPNPLYRKVFTRSERRALAAAEVENRTGAIFGRAAVRRAAGEEVDDKVLQEAVDKIQKEVDRAWRPDGDGYSDHRRRLNVPAIYGRGQGDEGVAKVVADDYLKRAKAAGLDPALPGSLVALGLSDAGRGGTRVGEVPIPGARAVDRDADRAVSWLALSLGDEVEGDSAQLAAFLTAARDRRAAIKVGRFESLAGAYRKEGMWFEAIRYAHFKPTRAIWYSLVAATSVWKFATLPLRPAWFVRNVVDNTVKVLLESHLDPRVLMVGGKTPGAGVRSVIAMNLNDVRAITRFFDKMFSTTAEAHLNQAIAGVWNIESKTLQRIFSVHGVDVPENLIEGSRLTSGLDTAETAREARLGWVQQAAHELGEDGQGVRVLARKWKEGIWDLMGNRPENYYRRGLYRVVAARKIREGMSEEAAHLFAWKRVEKTLFDYSQVSVFEENLKLFWPFIQWWRKNAQFWATTAVTKPWFTMTVLHADQARKDLHPGWPEWMERYVHVQDISDGLSKLPGGDWLAGYVSSLDFGADPTTYLSFTPMLRAFKSENPLLPPDREGWRFISTFVDLANDWGLSWNPLIRKPLEMAGVLNFRAWQHIFPETDLVQAFTRKYWHDRFGNRGLDLEAIAIDPIFQAIGQEGSGEILERRFDEFVQAEVAAQMVRGEEPDRAKAEETIRDFYLLQSLVGYVGGAYIRKMSPEDIHLYQITEALHDEETDFRDLSDSDQAAYRVFMRRKFDALAFDRYLERVPLVEAYYRQPDFEAKEAFKLEHPEILPDVEAAWTDGPPSHSFIHSQMLGARTQTALEYYALTDQLNLPFESSKAAESVWVSSELRAFWAKNDTPADVRRGMLSGAYHQHLAHVSETFFALPEDDWKQRQDFIAEHPELKRWWDEKNLESDDLSGILGQAKADLRDRYFEIVKESGFETAAAFFRDVPFIFEGTASEDKIRPDGTWEGGGGVRGHRGGFTRSQHAIDYLAAKAALDQFFALPQAEQASWLNGDSDAAKQVRAYFAKYAHPGGQAAEARDFALAKSAIDYYFSLPMGEREAWLRGGSALAAQAHEFFKKYGRKRRVAARVAPALAKWADTRNPELARRLEFWSAYYVLPPDERPLFVSMAAEDYGVFVYGPLGATGRHAREQAWLRQAIGHGLTVRAAMYVRIAPLMEIYFGLKTGAEKELFLRVNSEVREYLERFSSPTLTGNAHTDKLLERYFKLPFRSDARTAFADKHPAIGAYFDKRATPAERAMGALLDVYFKLDPRDRPDFRDSHPAIGNFFDKKKLEQDAFGMQAAAFDEADPRLARFRDEGRWWGYQARLRLYQLQQQRVRSMYVDELDRSPERRIPPSGGGRTLGAI